MGDLPEDEEDAAKAANPDRWDEGREEERASDERGIVGEDVECVILRPWVEDCVFSGIIKRRISVFHIEGGAERIAVMSARPRKGSRRKVESRRPM